MLVREQQLLTEVLSKMCKLVPFPLLGFDTDNNSVFMNETVRNYCNEAGGKAVVLHTVGYRRYGGDRRPADVWRSSAPTWCSSYLASERRGRRAKYVRPAERRKRPSAVVGVPTHS
jgi:hypothetical protein